MSQPLPCPHGRRQATALAAMHLRAVITAAGLRYLAPPLPRQVAPAAAPVMSARFQPRDEAGRFVSYALLQATITIEYHLTDAAYDAPATGTELWELLDLWDDLADECGDDDGDAHLDEVDQRCTDVWPGFLDALEDWLRD